MSTVGCGETCGVQQAWKEAEGACSILPSQQSSQIFLHAPPPSPDPGLTHPRVKTFFTPALCW